MPDTVTVQVSSSVSVSGPGVTQVVDIGYVASAGLAPGGAAGGDLSGTYPAPEVTSTHLASPLPTEQGGTGVSESTAAAVVTALGALLAGNDLSDLQSAATARANLGLGTAAVVALASLLQSANNLSDLASAAQARVNLGLGTAAVQAASAFDAAGSAAAALGTAEAWASGQFVALSSLPLPLASGGTGVSGSTTAGLLTSLGALQAADSLSDVASAPAARSNLGLGTAATAALSSLLQAADNLSDLASAATARSNLGLGSAATQPSSAFDAAGAAAAAQSAAETYAAGLQPTSGSPLPLTEGGTGVSESTDAALLAALGAAPLASPALTGTPTAPTAAALTDSTQVATTAYTDSAVAAETSRAEAAEALKLAKASNLSDVASAATARSNLGLGTAAVLSTPIPAADLSGVVTGVTAGDTSIVVGGTSAAPTLETGTLDVIAADHPPAANWSNNSKKITSLANGSGAQDAAAYGQIPAGGSTVTIAQGGTGQTGQQAAVNALAGSQSSGQYLRGNGTNVQMSAIQAADVPTLNQSTTGTASNITDTLDQVPAPAANVAMASHKLTGLANGSAAADSAAFGQIPAADTTASHIQPFGTAAVAGSNGEWADSGHVHLGYFAGMFGSGSDGAVTLDGSTTPSGFSRASSTYTLTRDIQATSLTVNNSVTLQMSGWRVFCRGTVTNNGTITGQVDNGTGANSSGNGASATTGASVGGGLQGGAGATGTGSNGGGGTISATAGAGGAGSSGSAGQAGSAISASFGYYSATPWPAVTAVIPILGTSHTTNGTNGGGGGGGDGTNFGGGGGAGGAIGVFVCWSFVNNGTISFPGGNGGSPTVGNVGGGGGGAGGILYLVTLTAWTNSGTATFAGGSLGTGHGSGANGNGGSAGQAVNVIVS